MYSSSITRTHTLPLFLNNIRRHRFATDSNRRRYDAPVPMSMCSLAGQAARVRTILFTIVSRPGTSYLKTPDKTIDTFRRSGAPSATPSSAPTSGTGRRNLNSRRLETLRASSCHAAEFRIPSFRKVSKRVCQIDSKKVIWVAVYCQCSQQGFRMLKPTWKVIFQNDNPIAKV